MIVALNEEIFQIIERLLGPRDGNFLSLYQAAQYLRDFNVEQLWSVQPFVRIKGTLHQRIRSLRP